MLVAAAPIDTILGIVALIAIAVIAAWVWA